MDISSIDSGEEWNYNDCFSDESSFYGEEGTEADYEGRAAAYDPAEYWQNQHQSPQHIAVQQQAINTKRAKAEALKSGTTPKPEPDGGNLRPPVSVVDPDAMDLDPFQQHQPCTPLRHNPEPSSPTTSGSLLYNPYEGIPAAKQLTESLTTFLHRLPPSTTTTTTTGPWIWIADPTSALRPTTPDIAGFKGAGTALLDEYMARKRRLEDQNPACQPAYISRLMKADRLWLESEIVRVAKASRVTCGKWMLFPYPNQVDAIWGKIATATLEGKLGCSAKAATFDESSQKPERLICIYTEDFSDQEDVGRVLLELRRMGLVRDGEEEKPIYYKCDAYTYLDILSGNEYKLKASMYCSKDVFKELKGGRT